MKKTLLALMAATTVGCYTPPPRGPAVIDPFEWSENIERFGFQTKYKFEKEYQTPKEESCLRSVYLNIDKRFVVRTQHCVQKDGKNGLYIIRIFEEKGGKIKSRCEIGSSYVGVVLKHATKCPVLPRGYGKDMFEVYSKSLKWAADPEDHVDI